MLRKVKQVTGLNQRPQNAETKLYHGATGPHSVIAGSIFSGEDQGIYCWWDLIRSKQVSSGSVCYAQVFARFSGHGNSVYNLIPLVKELKKNIF